MSNTIKIESQLEIDPHNGKIYFHENEHGSTLLRIGGLPYPIPRPEPGQGLDIGMMPKTAEWREYEIHFSWHNVNRHSTR